MLLHATNRKERWILALCLMGGAMLAIIGARFAFLPESAARTFGVPGKPAGYELHYIIALRNVWLGILAMGFAALRQWSALALWFATGALVCFADSWIAANATGRLPQVSFHVGCGVACAVLATLSWKIASKGR